jgi:nucleotide-binding universal stress UspA family protein
MTSFLNAITNELLSGGCSRRRLEMWGGKSRTSGSAKTTEDLLLEANTMALFSKILIPIDFSERCLGAARFAISLAEQFHSEVTFLHVGPPPALYPERYIEREVPPEKQLRDFLCAAFAHLNVKRILRTGPEVAHEIVKYARQEGSDLILMPTHGYGAFRWFLLGSTTAKVLYDTSCPVWTGARLAQGPRAEWINPRTILCAAGGHSGANSRV